MAQYYGVELQDIHRVIECLFLLLLGLTHRTAEDGGPCEGVPTASIPKPMTRRCGGAVGNSVADSGVRVARQMPISQRLI